MTRASTEEEGMDDLEKRVLQFRTLQLPGQPMAMHMGTSYLVSDLWDEITRIRESNAALVDAASVLAAILERNPSRWEGAQATERDAIETALAAIAKHKEQGQ